jgi:hypothetical protein
MSGRASLASAVAYRAVSAERGGAVGSLERTGAFAAAAVAYWATVHPRVSVYIGLLERRARAIGEEPLRELTLASLRKRENLEGAAAFAVLAPPHRRRAVIRALVSFQALYNHADLLAEQPGSDQVERARTLHSALLAALEPRAPEPARGPYVQAAIADCRTATARLPRYARVRDRAVAAAQRIVAFQSLSLGQRQDLRRWAQTSTPPGADLEWWESAGACGSSLPVLALLAAAATPAAGEEALDALEDAWYPAAAALHSLLDSLCDREEDQRDRQLNLIGCYEQPDVAPERLGALAARAREDALGAPAPARHRVLLAGMAASYLTRLRGTDPMASACATAVYDALGPPVGLAMSTFALRSALPRLRGGSAAPR